MRLIIFKNLYVYLDRFIFSLICSFLSVFWGDYYVHGNVVLELECICCING